ncbi:hypothetical protein BJI69_14400 [Luteibacter rhizovicinus DSM 16549]|uniref:Uncharacterized protein n=1 Tax=Luteibacter rhizovicinus DSM 16549 TaxID=1440763 RepID=A0A0G9HG23_9GAMM|nr:hypothetical protein [Luteibacter rhizovicinus]APG04966.1 hypothetical protein BJI69_14400 [Luteibacter rhizovicinus DSM 16549]KLD68441.1 hypothetical protein Y883_01755 [Luteibacter rhizovicinus DSM 16549]
MTVGFQIFLADGTTVQADDTYRNLSVNEQGTAVTTTATLAGGTSYVTFFRTGLTMPLLAVGGTGFAVGQQWFDAANNRWGFMVTSAGGIGSSVPFYVFDVPFATDPHFGLQVFNAAGQKTFDIMQKYLRVNDMYNSSVSSVVNKSYDASRVYACIHMITGFRISAVAGNTQLLATRISAGVVTSQGIIVDGAQGISTVNESPATILVADVTFY